MTKFSKSLHANCHVRAYAIHSQIRVFPWKVILVSVVLSSPFILTINEIDTEEVSFPYDNNDIDISTVGKLIDVKTYGRCCASA